MESFIGAAVCLRVILYQQQLMLTTDRGNALRHGAAAIEMNEEDSFRFGCYSALYQRIVNLKGVDIRLDQYWLEVVLCDGKDRSNIGISRNNDFISFF